jgi:hypothetical protein
LVPVKELLESVEFPVAMSDEFPQEVSVNIKNIEDKTCATLFINSAFRLSPNQL